MFKRSVLKLVAAAALAAVSGTASADWGYNMPYGVSKIAHETYDLHMMMFWVVVAIGIGVFSVMFYSLFAHRRSRHPEAAEFHESTVVEIAWTIVPFLILIAVAIPAAVVLVQAGQTRNPDMTIKVTGYQWLWHYQYMNQGVAFYSRLDAKSNQARELGTSLSPWKVPHYLRNVDHPMVVPIHKKIRILITSGDVIHSWWVPDLSIKKDAVPGYINAVWTKIDKPGVYRGQCAELCGRGHGYMPIVVKAVPVKQYDAWVKSHGGHVAWSKKDSSDKVAAGPSKMATTPIKS